MSIWERQRRVQYVFMTCADAPGHELYTINNTSSTSSIALFLEVYSFTIYGLWDYGNVGMWDYAMDFEPKPNKPVCIDVVLLSLRSPIEGIVRLFALSMENLCSLLISTRSLMRMSIMSNS
jgi:hypothetical protein